MKQRTQTEADWNVSPRWKWLLGWNHAGTSMCPRQSWESSPLQKGRLSASSSLPTPPPPPPQGWTQEISLADTQGRLPTAREPGSRPGREDLMIGEATTSLRGRDALQGLWDPASWQVPHIRCMPETSDMGTCLSNGIPLSPKTVSLSTRGCSPTQDDTYAQQHDCPDSQRCDPLVP